MAAGTTIRLPDALKAQATAYAEGLGISLNALIAVALQDYLVLRRPSAEGLPPPCDVPPVEAYAGEGDSPVLLRKVGRNEPCPCGSGKKFKLCCGR